ncbi:MAG: putative peptidoglycan-binding domain-containing protein [Planktotalea arctica]
MNVSSNRDVRAIAQKIVQREGGYVNDPDDPGGATNHGVTIHTMRRLGIDLNGDGRVNAGSNAVKILQALVSKMGFPCIGDGAIGPQTIAAVTRAYDAAPDHLPDAYGIERRNYYFRLADRRAASRKFARTRAGGKGGWIIRAEDFIAVRYHLTAQQFQQRIAKWA